MWMHDGGGGGVHGTAAGGSLLSSLAFLLQLVFEFLDLWRDDGAHVALIGVFGGEVLVVALGGIKYLQRHDLGDDGIFEVFLRGRLGGFGDFFLFFTMVENDGAVLRAAIVTLPIQSGGIMRVPEKIDDFLVADLGRFEFDLHDLGVAGGFAAHFFICRIFLGSAGVAADALEHAWNEFVLGFNAPEAAASDGGEFRFRGGRIGGGERCGGHGEEEEKMFHCWMRGLSVVLISSVTNTTELSRETE